MSLQAVYGYKEEEMGQVSSLMNTETNVKR